MRTLKKPSEQCCPELNIVAVSGVEDAMDQLNKYKGRRPMDLP